MSAFTLKECDKQKTTYQLQKRNDGKIRVLLTVGLN